MYSDWCKGWFTKTFFTVDLDDILNVDNDYSQCRDRLFIIGIVKNLKKNDFIFPEAIKMKNIRITNITHIKSVIKKMIRMSLSLIYKLPSSLITETVSEEYRLTIYLN